MNITWAQYRAFLGKYLGPHRGRLALLTGVLLAGIALQLVMPQLQRQFIDSAQGSEPVSVLVRVAVAFLVMGALGQLCTAISGYVGADLGWRATNAVRADLALHCLRLDMPFHHAKTPGEMIERIDGDVNALANFFSQFLVTVAGNALLLLGSLLFLYREDWRVGAALTVVAGVAAGSLIYARNLAVPAQRAEREQIAGLMGFVEERLGGLDDIRANGLGAHALRGFAELSRGLYHTGLKAAMTRNFLWFLTLTFFLLGNITALILGALLFQQGIVSLGTVYLIFQYNAMLRTPLEQITRQLQDLQQAGASLLRVQELYALTPAIQDGPGVAPPPGPLEVVFDDVTFAYGEAEPVLHGVTFTLQPGRTLGVLGRTGSGKSTLMRLLFRLYDVSAGQVCVGGADVRAWRLDALRHAVGLITQEVQLFHASVRDNLTFFDAAIPDARIHAVIDELGLREWLDKLPEGLDTQLQAGGTGLSAGESQLLAFTRVFLMDPRLVLLDEPSSRVDPATERLMDRAVARLLRDRTGIIIAHRLGTVSRVDEILVLDDGRLLEHGARVALAADPASHFAHLLQTGLQEERV
jgi:ATP-binding cassette subfamily B protein